MLRLEQITALVLAAALAIPSYWFFWTMAGGGGYERRVIKDINQDSFELPSDYKINYNPPLAFTNHCMVSKSSMVDKYSFTSSEVTGKFISIPNAHMDCIAPFGF